MKVLLLNRISQQRGGADKYFLELGQILSSRGNQVCTFTARCPGDPDVPGQEDFPPSFHEATEPPPTFGDKVRFFFDGIYSERAREGLSRLIAREKPDVAHLNNIFFQLSSSVIDALAEARVPVVFSLHDYQLFCSNAYLYRDGRVCTDCAGGKYWNGLKHRCYRDSGAASLMSYLSKRGTAKRELTRKVSAYVVPTDSMRRQVEALGLAGARIETIPNPFRIGALKVRRQWEPYVVFYGRLIRPKGIYTLLEASRRLPSIPLRIYGSGPEQEGVERFIRDHGLGHVQLNTTLRWGPELEEIVGSGRFVIVPTEWPAPLDYTACEALALGRAVVTGNLGGNQDIVRDGVGGRIFRAGDPEDLARVMAELYEDLPRLQRMGEGGRQNVENSCSEDRYYSGIMSLYRDVTGAGKA
jgi:glycosyltransferase involved in cell wall biosynthesis